MADSPDGTTSADEQTADRAERYRGPAIVVGKRAAWLAIALAAAGLAFGLLPLAYGELAEQPTSEVTEEGEQSEEELTDEEQAYQDAAATNQVIDIVILLGPYFGVLVGVLAALAAGVAAGETDQPTLVVGAAIGAFVGVTVFVLLSSALATSQWQTVQEPIEIADVELDYVASAINGVGTALPAAVGAAIAAFAGDRLGA